MTLREKERDNVIDLMKQNVYVQTEKKVFQRSKFQALKRKSFRIILVSLELKSKKLKSVFWMMMVFFFRLLISWACFHQDHISII